MEALRRIAEETIEIAKHTVLDTTGFALEANLRCELLCNTSETNLDVGALDNSITPRTRLLFLYRCAHRDVDAEILHSVRRDSIITRGSVPLPPYWKARLSATVVPQKAAALALELGAEGRVQTEVYVLGAPKKLTSTCDRGLLPGALFQLSGDDEPRVVLLCEALDDLSFRQLHRRGNLHRQPFSRG